MQTKYVYVIVAISRLAILVVFKSTNAFLRIYKYHITKSKYNFRFGILATVIVMLLWYVYFLHDRLWISPWIKSIFNELDITIHVIASQLSGHCDAISNQLWRHQQNENRARETRGRCVKHVLFIVIYGFVMSYKKQNNVCTLATNRFCAQ